MYKLSVSLAPGPVYCLIRNSLEACPATLPTDTKIFMKTASSYTATPQYTKLTISGISKWTLTGHIKYTPLTSSTTDTLVAIHDDTNKAYSIHFSVRDATTYFVHDSYASNSNTPLVPDPSPVIMTKGQWLFFSLQCGVPMATTKQLK